MAVLGVCLQLPTKLRVFIANSQKKGLLGSAVVDQLAAAGFAVTVLTRNRSSLKDLPSGIEAVEVDYNSVESLANALRGQDVIVTTTSAEALSNQKPIIDAAIAAGVKRFIPSDFGSFTHDPEAQMPSLSLPP